VEKIMAERLKNFIGGKWINSTTSQHLEVRNPATDEILALVPLSLPSEVDQAAQAAATAQAEWRRVPAAQRVQYLFKLKTLLEENFEELACQITIENGKVLDDARGEMRRAIENVETACGIPTLMMGDFSEDIARGVDEYMIRQPVGVVATIAPFNFPGMIPFWYLPYAIAAGNAIIIKPSERTPLTMQKVFGLLEQAGIPAGVVNLVHGGPEVVNAILDHPIIQGITFVGSTPVARHIYSRASRNGKRVQAQGGAKNPLIILPDADPELTTNIVADSVYGNAGQRCLAASNIITVGEAQPVFRELLAAAASKRTVGYGLEQGVQMGPVISRQSLARLENLIQTGVSEGAEVLVEGRGALIKGYENGYFMRPTILENVLPGTTISKTEIFGPVMCLMHMNTADEAIEFVNSGQYGNQACIFTSSGAAARKFRYEVQAGNIGINIGVAAPMAFFPFSGWRESFFGALHGQGKHAVEFFTQTKVVVERWLKEWTRTF
jgi:malonate-semialdehyde dehydrogenase (acetylating)/methylmalonate-semialdehyde dehydrogenase